MNFSETTFVLPAEKAGHRRADADLHARRGAADGRPSDDRQHVRARAHGRHRSRPRAVRVRLRHRSGAGDADVEGRRIELCVDEPGQTGVRPAAGESGGAAAALSLSAPAVAGTGLPVQVVSCGVPFLFVPLTSRAAVDNAHDQPRRARRPAAVGEERRARRLPVFRRARRAIARPSTAACSRRRLGVAEDPATGIASGPLGCYLVRHKVVPPAKARRACSACRA